MDAIVTEGLSKTYRALGRAPVRSLDPLDLRIGEREVFGFLGRNGAGKTTTIKMLCGLVRPTAGTARIFGHGIRAREARKCIGYLPEQPYFYEYLTPRETIDFYGRLQGLHRTARAAVWEKLAELLDLHAIADRRIKGFSKGMRQRLGFAVALVGDPPLLILDEPMSGLDPLGRRQIRELILRLRDEKKTIFFSSHVLGDVEQICDRVGILVQGKLTQEGRIDALLRKQASQVEVVARNVPAETANALATRAESHRALEEQDLFVFSNEDEANQAVRALLGAGGTLVSAQPIRETLEDYFMRHQDEATRKEPLEARPS